MPCATCYSSCRPFDHECQWRQHTCTFRSHVSLAVCWLVNHIICQQIYCSPTVLRSNKDLIRPIRSVKTYCEVVHKHQVWGMGDNCGHINRVNRRYSRILETSDLHSGNWWLFLPLDAIRWRALILLSSERSRRAPQPLGEDEVGCGPRESSERPVVSCKHNGIRQSTPQKENPRYQQVDVCRALCAQGNSAIFRERYGEKRLTHNSWQVENYNKIDHG